MRWPVMAMLASTLLANSAAAVPADDGRTLAFDVYRSGKKAGTHTLRFRQQGPDLMVDVDIRLKGRIFLLSFSYEHQNREVWRDGRLLRIDTRTKTNDKVQTVTGRATSDGLDVRTNDEVRLMPADVMPSSYWHPDMPNHKALLDTQKGKLASIVVDQIVSTTRNGRPVNEYRLTGGLKANVVYDGNGCFVGLSFKVPVDGSAVTYKLVSQPDAARAPDLLANPLIARCMRQPVRTAQSE